MAPGLAAVFVLMSLVTAWVFSALAQIYRSREGMSAPDRLGHWLTGCALKLGGMALGAIFLILAALAVLYHVHAIDPNLNLVDPGALRPGAAAVVAVNAMPPVRVDEQGQPGGQALMVAPEGLPVDILDGPTEHGGQRWWKIRTSSGYVGWLPMTTPTGQAVLRRR